MGTKEVCNTLILGIKDYFKKNNFKKAVIGLSGGVDSSVSAYLAVKALGNKNVTALLMPDLITSRQSIQDAKSLVKKLKIKHYVIPINDFIKNINNINKKLKKELAIANAKARIRMTILYYFANTYNSLVIGTSDKSETVLGYATKFGDNAADIEPIGELWKTGVIELGKFLKVPESITSKKPSPELMEGKTADSELGATYDVLDKILKLHFEEKLNVDAIVKEGFDRKVVVNVFERVRLNEHKRKMPTVIKIV